MKTVLLAATLILWQLPLFLGGCATTSTANEFHYGPRTIIIKASYDEVWQAVQQAMANYPIEINNVDEGLITTDSIRNGQVWSAPFNEHYKYPNFTYRLKVIVLRGGIKGHPACKVFITKYIDVQKDFFSGVEHMPSDGLEEGSILYRIERNIQIQRALKAAYQRGNSD